jgi:aminomethyltransferase
MSTDARIVQTAFDEVQKRMGVELMDWEGWYWPNHFGDPVAEHNWVREHVGVWDESPLRKWDFSGPDALAAADRIFTNDMLGLDTGQVRYGPFCDGDGNMVGDGTVFKFTDASCWVITALDSDLDHFQDVVDGMEVEIEPITEKLPHLQIQGPKSRELLADLTDESVEDLGYFRFFPHQVHVGRVPVWVSRTGYSGELGYEVFCDPDYAEELWGVGHRGGREAVRPRGRGDAPDRVGLIFIGYDYFQHETNPYDMSLDKVIRLDTGDFHGKVRARRDREEPAEEDGHARGAGRRGARVRRGRDEGRRRRGHAHEPVREPDARQGDRHGRARGGAGREREPGRGRARGRRHGQRDGGRLPGLRPRERAAAELGAFG